jgi:uncharacterized ion transporter superfamily protein YfcC
MSEDMKNLGIIFLVIIVVAVIFTLFLPVGTYYKYDKIVFEDNTSDYCYYSQNRDCGITYTFCLSNRTYKCVVNSYTTNEYITKGGLE